MARKKSTPASTNARASKVPAKASTRKSSTSETAETFAKFNEIFRQKAAVTAAEKARRPAPAVKVIKPKRTEAEIRAAIAKDEADEKAAYVAKLVAECGVPLAEHGDADTRTADTLPAELRSTWERTKRLIEEMIDAKRCIIALLGAPGSAKTTIGAGIVLRRCRQEQIARYLTAWEYTKAVNASLGYSSKKTIDGVERFFCQSPILVIDEFHRFLPRSAMRESVEALIHRRFDEGKSTLLISNETVDDFIERVGPSIVSRIHDGGRLFEFPARDLRRPG